MFYNKPIGKYIYKITNSINYFHNLIMLIKFDNFGTLQHPKLLRPHNNKSKENLSQLYLGCSFNNTKQIKSLIQQKMAASTP